MSHSSERGPVAGGRLDPVRLIQGTSIEQDSATWRVWAPFADEVKLVLEPGEESGVRQERRMAPVGRGFYEHREAAVSAGRRYGYRLDGGPVRPDPASRWQPDGVHTLSALFDASAFPWTDAAWRGVPRQDLVIYELHVGAFTAQGTFEAVIPRLDALRELGVTAIEIMPVGQFPGRRSWGYDGVHPYAVQNSYGGPAGLMTLVDAAHARGLAVILDVVYNHLGPEGNYLGEFGPYFTDRYHTPWGAAVNYDGPDCDPVRDYVCENAAMWVRDFHIDGLRLDAIHTIYDFSARHILLDLREAVHAEGLRSGRIVHVIGETDQNDARLTRRSELGGLDLDAVWADDLHHSLHALLTGERHGYYEDYGEPADIAKALRDVFVYDGAYSKFRRRRFGSPVRDQDRSRFVVCLQNHDQVGNRPLGDRMATLLPGEACRLGAAIMLLSPCIPLVFMGEEYGERRPFPYFCSFDDEELIAAVRSGRRREFGDFGADLDVPDPQAESTFQSAVLSWTWDDASGAGCRRLYADLLRARREWPPLRSSDETRADLLSCPDGGEVLQIIRGTGPYVVAFANLSSSPLTCPPSAARQLLLSTEFPRYGGAWRETCGEELLAYEVRILGGEEFEAFAPTA